MYHNNALIITAVRIFNYTEHLKRCTIGIYKDLYLNTRSIHVASRLSTQH
jgi:hypothetical protein